MEDIYNIACPTPEVINKRLFEMIPQEQKDRVMTFDNGCDISCEFMGFVDTYYYLSKLIPKHFTIVDIGAAFNAQCYFFREHKKYIAVQPPGIEELFECENTEIYRMTAQQFIDRELPNLNLSIGETFAICNYVPNWYNENPMELVRNHFDNCYTFYPVQLR